MATKLGLTKSRVMSTTYGDWARFRVEPRIGGQRRRAKNKVRYSLAISISASGQAVDLYSKIAALVEVRELQISIG